MKKLLPIIVLLHLAYVGHSQQYIPFPTDNAYWLSSFQSYDAGVDYWNIMLFVNGEDTVIKNITYHKLILRAQLDKDTKPNIIYDTKPDIVYGMFREDNGKVYYRGLKDYPIDGYAFSDSEVLLYDYTLKAGDYNPNKSLYISSIDSMVIGGVSHSRYNWSNGNYYIDGVGSNSGFLSQYNEIWAGGFSDYYFCNYTNAATGATFKPGNYSCPYIFPYGTPTSVSNVSTQELKVFPNPFTDRISIESPKECTITLYNNVGAVILKKPLPAGNSIINDIANNAPGIYYLIIKDDEGAILKNQKLIKL